MIASAPARHRRTLHPGSLVVLAALLGACGDGGPGAAPALARWALDTPDVRFGSLEDPASALVPVEEVALASDGGLWVAQGQDGEVLRLSAGGESLGRIGGLGDGPGEFASVSDLGWLGDTLWVSDGRARRVTFLGPEGETRGTLAYPSADVGEDRAAAFTAPVPGGALFVVGPGPAALMNPGAPRAGDDPVVITPRTGGVPRPVAVRSGTRSRLILADGAGGEIRAVAIFEQPWADASLLATPVGGEGVVVVDRPVAPDAREGAYRVTRITLTGDTVWSTSTAFTPVPVDPVHRDTLLARYAQGAFDEGMLREALFLPASHPPASSVFVGRDGRVWVGRERPVDAARWEWDVFAPDGRLEARATTPVGVELRAADAAVVWGVETDALDVPYLVRYRLPRSSPAGG